jgi:hypothetical protein
VEFSVKLGWVWPILDLSEPDAFPGACIEGRTAACRARPVAHTTSPPTPLKTSSTAPRATSLNSTSPAPNHPPPSSPPAPPPSSPPCLHPKDYFPCQHQLYYPKGSAFWYEPVFKVITLQVGRGWGGVAGTRLRPLPMLADDLGSPGRMCALGGAPYCCSVHFWGEGVRCEAGGPRPRKAPAAQATTLCRPPRAARRAAGGRGLAAPQVPGPARGGSRHLLLLVSGAPCGRVGPFVWGSLGGGEAFGAPPHAGGDPFAPAGVPRPLPPGKRLSARVVGRGGGRPRDRAMPLSLPQIIAAALRNVPAQPSHPNHPRPPAHASKPN